MPSLSETLADRFAALPSFEAGGRTFTMFFVGVKEPTLPTERHIVIDFGARDGAESFRGQLQLAPDRYNEAEIADLAVSAMTEIIEGRLPPGARSLL
jgi:hypothetical protein